MPMLGQCMSDGLLRRGQAQNVGPTLNHVDRVLIRRRVQRHRQEIEAPQRLEQLVPELAHPRAVLPAALGHRIDDFPYGAPPVDAPDKCQLGRGECQLRAGKVNLVAGQQACRPRQGT